MTEAEARDEARILAGPAFARVELYAALLLAESERQNLISAASAATIWQRHLLDALQLVRFLRDGDRTWVDVGSGAGLPGLVIACLDRVDMVLLEPRRRRTEFLRACVDALDLRRVTVVQGMAERYALGPVDVVSARAVARLPDLFGMCRGFTSSATRYILPRGRSAIEDVRGMDQGRAGVFHVEQSITDVDAGIVIADRVVPG